MTKYSSLGVFQQPWPGVSPTAILNEKKALGTRLVLLSTLFIEGTLVAKELSWKESGYQNESNIADDFVQKVLQKARIIGGRIWDRIILTEKSCTQVHVADTALSSALAGITSPLCLGVLQTGFFRPFRDSSSNLKPLVYRSSLRVYLFVHLW